MMENIEVWQVYIFDGHSMHFSLAKNIVGALIDRFTPSKGDKFKPWIKYGGIILAFASAIMFVDSSSWNYTLKLIICIGLMEFRYLLYHC